VAGGRGAPRAVGGAAVGELGFFWGGGEVEAGVEVVSVRAGN
jgi:hypothetical protein